MRRRCNPIIERDVIADILWCSVRVRQGNYPDKPLAEIVAEILASAEEIFPIEKLPTALELEAQCGVAL